MAVSEAQERALKKYAQSPKGKKALDKAHKKRANTDEYRAYQREKQKEYRRRRKLEATGNGAEPGDSQATKELTPELVPLVLHARIPLNPEIEAEVREALRSLPNRSLFIWDAVLEKLVREGLLQHDQDNGSRGAA